MKTAIQELKDKLMESGTLTDWMDDLFDEAIAKERQMVTDAEQFKKECDYYKNQTELREAAKEVLHLHLCEQEGLSSGMPTPEMWMVAVDKLSAALYSPVQEECKHEDVPFAEGVLICKKCDYCID